MAEEEDKRPIIIRRKVVKGGGHHGGAWKVAYADFVTAMMAFFLLMWLLNATTEDQRKGLADYFSPTIPVHRTSGGSDGPLGGRVVAAEEALVQNGQGAQEKRPTSEKRSKGSDVAQDGTRPLTLEGIAEALLAKGGESAIADKVLRHVRLRRTNEGLVIEVAELPGAPLFNGASAAPTPTMTELMSMIAEVVGPVENRVAVDNHLNAGPITRPGAPGWRLTSERALAARDMLAEGGLPAQRFVRVSGEADRAHMYDPPQDLRNRRTEIILMLDDANG